MIPKTTANTTQGLWDAISLSSCEKCLGLCRRQKKSVKYINGSKIYAEINKTSSSSIFVNLKFGDLKKSHAQAKRKQVDIMNIKEPISAPRKR